MPGFAFRRPRHTPSAPEAQGPFFSPENDTAFFSAQEATVQPKLTVGAPNDRYEQEADAVAEQVVNQSEQSPVQRMGMEEEEPLQGKLQREAMEEEETMQGKLQRQEMEEEETMQGKLQRQEMEEEEMMQGKLQRQEMEEEEMQAKPDLMKMEEEEELQAKPDGSRTASAHLSQRIQRQVGQGQPLPAKTQQQMSQAFGHDFSGVSVHTGAESAELNQQLGAHAFTHGQDVFFNEGKFQPETTSGQELLAHELTHVVQQTGKEK